MSDESQIPNMDSMMEYQMNRGGGWGFGGRNGAMDQWSWGRARKEKVSHPKTSKTSKEQKRQKKARKLQRRLKKQRG
jgi:hypothetical protein